MPLLCGNSQCVIDHVICGGVYGWGDMFDFCHLCGKEGVKHENLVPCDNSRVLMSSGRRMCSVLTCVECFDKFKWSFNEAIRSGYTCTHCQSICPKCYWGPSGLQVREAEPEHIRDMSEDELLRLQQHIEHRLSVRRSWRAGSVSLDMNELTENGDEETKPARTRLHSEETASGSSDPNADTHSLSSRSEVSLSISLPDALNGPLGLSEAVRAMRNHSDSALANIRRETAALQKLEAEGTLSVSRDHRRQRKQKQQHPQPRDSEFLMPAPSPPRTPDYSPDRAPSPRARPPPLQTFLSRDTQHTPRTQQPVTSSVPDSGPNSPKRRESGTRGDGHMSPVQSIRVKTQGLARRLRKGFRSGASLDTPLTTPHELSVSEAAIVDSREPIPPRMGHTITLVGDTVYVVGGQDAKGKLVTRVDAIHLLRTDHVTAPDADSGDGSKSKPLPVRVTVSCGHQAPVELLGHSAVAYRNCVLVFGGGNGKSSTNRIYEYCVESGEWRLVPTSGKAPAPRVGHAAALVSENTRMLVVGGFVPRVGYTFDVWTLDLGGMVWSKPLVKSVGLAPAGRMAHSAVLLHNNTIHIFGGSGGKSNVFNDSYELIYDPLTGVVTVILLEAAGFSPVPRTSHCAVDCTPDSLLLVGGMGADGVGLGDVVAYEPDLNRVAAVRLFNPLPRITRHAVIRTPRHIAPQSFIIFGGLMDGVASSRIICLSGADPDTT